MQDFVEILGREHFNRCWRICSNQAWNKNLFDVTVYAENMQDMFFLHIFVICGRHRGHQEQSENIDQQGNISVFTFKCIKKDN